MRTNRSKWTLHDWCVFWALIGLICGAMGLGMSASRAIQDTARETIPSNWMDELHACQEEEGDRCYLEYSGREWELVVAPYTYEEGRV